MTGEAVQKLLKEEINSLKFEIPADVFQFTFNRNDAAQYLETHPNVPFILRISSLKGYFSLDIPAKDRKSITRTCVSQSIANEKEFNLSEFKNGVFTQGRNLKEYIKEYWDPEHKCILSDSELAERKNEIWENHKHLMQKQFEMRREKEEANEHRRLLMEAQEKLNLELPRLFAKFAINDTIPPQVTQKEFDLFNKQQSTQQGPGFFQRQALQQNMQQRPEFYQGQAVQQNMQHRPGFYQGQALQQGSGFFHGQLVQQNTQQELNYFPQQTQRQNGNTGF